MFKKCFGVRCLIVVDFKVFGSFTFAEVLVAFLGDQSSSLGEQSLAQIAHRRLTLRKSFWCCLAF